MLAIDGFEFGVADAISDGAEGGTCLDRLQLFGITDENELCPAHRCLFDKLRHLFRRDHAGFVQNQNGLVIEMVATLSPAQFPGRQCTGKNTRFLFQSFGRLPRQGGTNDTIPGRFPGLARRLHHRGLAGAGAADHGCNPLRTCDTLDGRFLLIREALMELEYRFDDLLSDAM